MSAQRRARARRWTRGAQADDRPARRKPAYTPPPLPDPTTCEVWRTPLPPMNGNPAVPGHRCGLPVTHLGYVKGQPAPTFPLCDVDAARWPNDVVQIGT